MTKLFSERIGTKPTLLNLDDMPIGLRNRLWNIIEEYIEKNPNGDDIIKYLWDKFFKETIDSLDERNIYI